MNSSEPHCCEKLSCPSHECEQASSEDRQKNDINPSIDNASSQMITIWPFNFLAEHIQSLRGDFHALFFLLFLYTLQGIPIGFSRYIENELLVRDISYRQQLLIMITRQTFSFKILWAPIVDAFYFERVGRRKTWVIPCNYTMGILLMVMSFVVPAILNEMPVTSSMLPDNQTKMSNSNDDIWGKVVIVYVLTQLLLFTTATQDVAVDGWAITMLSRKNVGYAAIVNQIGQVLGNFMSTTLVWKLHNKDFANNFRMTPGDHGFVQPKDFMLTSGLIFLVSTTLIAIFVKERKSEESETDESKDNEVPLTIAQTYSMLAKLLCLKPILLLCLFLLFQWVCDGSFHLFQKACYDYGFTIDDVADIHFWELPIDLLMPFMISKSVVGPEPLNIYRWAYPHYLFVNILWMSLFYFTPSFYSPKGFPSYYWFFYMLVDYINQILYYCLSMSVWSFFAKISDPRIGGTYMTLLLTASNLGSNWPTWLMMSIGDELKAQEKLHPLCLWLPWIGSVCLGGIYWLTILCTLLGIVFITICYATGFIRWLQESPIEKWRIAAKFKKSS